MSEVPMDDPGRPEQGVEDEAGEGAEVIPFAPPRAYEGGELGVKPPRVRVNLTTTNPDQVLQLMEAALSQHNRVMRVEPFPGAGVFEDIEPVLFHVPGTKNIVRVLPDDDCSMVEMSKTSGFQPYLFRWMEPVRNVQRQGAVIEEAVMKFDSHLVDGFTENFTPESIPPLIQPSQAPLFKADGTIRWKPGYDADTRMYVRPGCEAQDIQWKERLKTLTVVKSQEEALEVGRRLTEIFGTFAYRYDSSLADAVALALTPTLLPFIGDSAIPLGAIIALQPKSGKTTLAETVFAVGGMKNGVDFRMASWVKENDEKFSKDVLDTAALSGRRGIMIDNVKGILGGPDLEGQVTARKRAVRRMRTYDDKPVDWNVLIVATLNQPLITPDMVRRVIPIGMRQALDMEDNTINALKQRVWEAVNSRAMAWDLGVLISHWVAVGSPLGNVGGSLGSDDTYYRWAQVVSGVLEVAGIEGFGQARDDLLETLVSVKDGGHSEWLGTMWKCLSDAAHYRENGNTGAWDAGAVFASAVGEPIALERGADGRVLGTTSFLAKELVAWLKKYQGLDDGVDEILEGHGTTRGMGRLLIQMETDSCLETEYGPLRIKRMSKGRNNAALFRIVTQSNDGTH